MENANVNFLEKHPNKQNGKAVADIKAVYFLKHENGIEPIMSQDLLTNMEKYHWFAALTVRSSVQASQDTPSFEEIHVDQFNQPIGLTTEPGAFSFECNCPSFLKEDLENFLGKGALKPVRGQETGSQVSIDGKPLYGFDLGGDIMGMCVMLVTRTNDFIIFPNVQVAFTFMQDGKVFGFKASGQVMATTRKANSFIYIAHEPKVNVEIINLDKDLIEFDADAALQPETLIAQVLPADATDRKVVWESNDKTIVTVAEDADDNTKAIVTATGKGGEAAITVKAVDGGDAQMTCTVKVLKKASEISLSKSESALTVGAEETLVATVGPADRYPIKPVVWASDNEAVATVDENGKVTAIAEGEANISASVDEVSASCAYIVSAE